MSFATPGGLSGLLFRDQRFACDARTHDRTTWLSLAGELHAPSVSQFRAALERVSFEELWVIADLRLLTSVDTAGLGLLVEADARARAIGRRLMLVHVPDELAHVFDRLKRSEQLRIIDADESESAKLPAPSLGLGRL